MIRKELENKILQQYPKLKQTNLRNLTKPQLESWVNNSQVILSVETLVKIFIERNERAETNQRLNNHNVSLVAKLTNWSKSEIIQSFKNLFGHATKADDLILSEIGAISRETVRNDLDESETIIQEAENIAQQYINRYGNENDKK